MLRLLTAAMIVGAMSGCTADNISLSRLQFSAETVAFPENYQTEAARVVARSGVDRREVQVSYPREAIGASAFGPKRWYSCLRGMPGPAFDLTRIPNMGQAIDGLMWQPQGTFDTVLFYSGEGRRPSVRTGFDSPLCREVKFQAIEAEAPIS